MIIPVCIAKNKIYIRVLAVSILISTFTVIAPVGVGADGAFLSILPSTGSFTIGNTFELSIFLDTGENNVNAIEINLKFDPTKLQVVTPSKGISVVGEWIFPPSFSNTEGTISLVGGFLSEGINTSEGLITTIVFEAISQGLTDVYFLDSSKVLVGGEGGVNILKSVSRGTYNILPAPFKGPRIFSDTHPNQDKWYRNNSPSFNWDKIEGAEGYNYTLDDDPSGEPHNTINIQSTFISFDGVEDGIQYFHVKAKKSGAWGRTSHFQIKIDQAPPLEFKPHLEPFSMGAGKNLLVYFSSSDLLSGIEHYKIKITNLTNPQNIIFSGWTRIESPFRLSKEKPGTFEFIVRAFDKAGNFREGKVKINIISSFLILTGDGVQINDIFLSWWRIYFIIIILLVLAGYLLFRLLRTKRKTLEIDLQKEIKEAEKEIEDVKRAEEKLRELRIKEETAQREWRRLKGTLKEEIKPPSKEDKIL